MPAGALERAVALMQRLSDGASELSVAQLADRAGMPTSTAYRLLGELAGHGLVARSADGTVSLGPRLVALGRSAEAGLQARLVTPATPIMQRLAEETSETVLLTAPCGLEALALHVVEADVHSVRLSHAVLRRAPMHLGASGKVLAAHLEASERQRLIDAVSVPGLAEALETIVSDGYVYTVAELDAGAAGVAAPILDRRGRLLAGLSIAGPAERIAADFQDGVTAVMAAARRIERAIA